MKRETHLLDCIYWAALFVLSSQSFSLQATTRNNTTNDENAFALKAISESISRPDTPRGFVIASPSTENPDYYFHWVRDAALVMDLVRDNAAFYDVGGMIADYLGLESRHQKIFKLTDQGEPKFTKYGESFKGPWGRPQNDGPALRALVLSRFALDSLEANPDSREWIEKNIYRGELPANTVVKKDLEYVSHHWHEPDFDLWEEIQGEHYYTRTVQRAAMLQGSKIAQKMNDFAASHWYELQAQRMKATLEMFWSERDAQLLSTINRVGGLDYKYSKLDSSVILAINHVWDVATPSDTDIDRTLSTIEKLINEFKIIYPISHDGGAVPLGRYPEDTYFGGNPWFLLNSALIEFVYRTLSKYEGGQSFWVSSTNESFLKNVLKLNVSRGQLLTGDSYTNFEAAMIAFADRYVRRIKKHMGQDGQLDEQFHRASGYMTGAPKLTWSYAAFVSANKQRAKFFKN